MLSIKLFINDRENYFIAIGWERANLSLIYANKCARVHNFLSQNKWVILWRLEPLKIYTTRDIWKLFQIALA